MLKLAEVAENERDPEIKIPAEIARRETLISKIDEAQATIEAREAQRHAGIKAKHAHRLEQRKEQQRQTGKKPKGPRARLPRLRVEPTAQINLTDEESRIMPTADSFLQGYNAQACVTLDSQFVVSTSVTQATSDKEQLTFALTRLAALPDTLGSAQTVVADAGYYSKANVEACEAAQMTLYLAMGREQHNSWLTQKLRKAEPLAGNADAVERMAHRLQSDDGRKMYAQRKSTVEPVFGIVKSAMGCRTFLLRGLEKVTGEWNLVCTAYNLKHLHALVAACPKGVKVA